MPKPSTRFVRSLTGSPGRRCLSGLNKPGASVSRRRTLRGRFPWSRSRQIEVFSEPLAGERPLSRLVPEKTRPADARSAKEPLRLGLHRTNYSDLYHGALVITWPRFLAIGLTAYLILNLLFAAAFFVQAGSINHARAGDFQDAFFFSVQTMATIGYGVLTPATLYANIVVTAETMVSLVYTAFITGLIFARFSRPTARVNFARVVTISTHNGLSTLTVRMANGRSNQIVEAEVSLTLLRSELTHEGGFMRRFYDLNLVRSHTPIFSLSFIAMHIIGPDSPLHGVTAEKLEASDAELLVTVTGLDGTMTQTIHARTSYAADEILFGYHYADIFGFTAGNRLVIDDDQFDAVVPEG